MNSSSRKWKIVALLGALVGLAIAATHMPSAPGPLAGHGSDASIGFLGAGMLINKENITNVFISLKTTFNNAFAAGPSNWKRVAMLVPSTTSQNDYSWMSNFPKMREWIGDKIVKSLAAFNYTIKNKDWEATVEVDRNDIDDDNLGIYGPQAQMAGLSAAELPDDIVFGLLNNGFINLCYDGQYYFDVDHPVRQLDGTMTTVSNKGTLKLSIDSLAALDASLGAADIALMEMKDDEGRSLNIIAKLLVVPPALKTVANAIVTTDRLEDGKPNPYKGAFEVLVEPRLTSRTAWFLLDVDKPIKPIVYQERKKPVFVQQTGMDNDDVFSRKKFKFGAEARANGGYGFWQLGFGSTGTATYVPPV